MQKRLQVLADPAPIKSHTFFEMYLIQQKIHLKKNTSVGSEHQLNPTLVFFLNDFFFEFQKKLQVLDQVHVKKTTGSANTCNFFAFLKKSTTTGSSHFLSPNGQG